MSLQLTFYLSSAHNNFADDIFGPKPLFQYSCGCQNQMLENLTTQKYCPEHPYSRLFINDSSCAILHKRTMQNQEENRTEDNPQHGYKCECTCCLNKFGNLPVLLHCIETRKDDNQPEEPLNLSEPSTSGLNQESSYKVRDMTCQYCSKKFTHKGDMNKHLRKHSGEKPFPCPICNKLFSHTSNLNRHVKVHTGDKPFQCENCGKHFGRKDKLEGHKSTQICKKRSLKKLQ